MFYGIVAIVCWPSSIVMSSYIRHVLAYVVTVLAMFCGDVVSLFAVICGNIVI